MWLSAYLLLMMTKGAAGHSVLRASSPYHSDLVATDDMRTLARLKEMIDPLGSG